MRRHKYPLINRRQDGYSIKSTLGTPGGASSSSSFSRYNNVPPEDPSNMRLYTMGEVGGRGAYVYKCWRVITNAGRYWNPSPAVDRRVRGPTYAEGRRRRQMPAASISMREGVRQSVGGIMVQFV